MFLTWQLALLMLIERYEEVGISVVSANTDGIVIKCLHSRIDEMNAIAKQWEHDTTFKTDETRYKILCSRDINDYIALKEDNKIKGKGEFAKVASSQSGCKINPSNEICITAIEELLKHETPIEETINECKDITQFLNVRSVTGGAVKDGYYLGRVVRWYISKNESTPIIYAKTGNKVPNSDNGKPLMQLPDRFPDDVKHMWYIRKTARMLEEAGYY